MGGWDLDPVGMGTWILGWGLDPGSWDLDPGGWHLDRLRLVPRLDDYLPVRRTGSPSGGLVRRLTVLALGAHT